MNRSNKKRKLAAEARQRESDAAAAERKQLREEVSRELTEVADSFDELKATIEAIKRGEVIASEETRELARKVVERRATEPEIVDDEKWARDLIDSTMPAVKIEP